MKKIFSFFLCLLIFAALAVPAFAAAPTPIQEVEDLELLRKDPKGSFRLDADLDLRNLDWVPIDFSGTFDGNGHTLLNLTVKKLGEKKVTFWDGNNDPYLETRLAGFFGHLQNAEVKDLTLLGVNIDLTVYEDCFIGGIAGCAEDSEIENCSVSGILSLRATAKAEGVGGIVGFAGASEIEDCSADVTLICIDEDAVHKDEQFLGGIAASGFPDIEDCKVSLQGYISEYGYVHSGGLMGLYRVYRDGWFEEGSISDNSVSGSIHFFEVVDSRRAYCEALIGERLTDYVSMEGNSADFQRDEVFTYEEELLPHNCANPDYAEELFTLPGGITYTEYSCRSCGEYSFLGNYYLPGMAPEPEESSIEEVPVPEETPEDFIAPAAEEPAQTEPSKQDIILIAPSEELTVQSQEEARPNPNAGEIETAIQMVFRRNGPKSRFLAKPLVPIILVISGLLVVAGTAILLIKKR